MQDPELRQQMIDTMSQNQQFMQDMSQNSPMMSSDADILAIA